MGININGIAYDVKPGYAKEKHFNTKLDTALVIIPQVAEFSIEPLDEAFLDNKYYYVSTIRRKIASFAPVKKWNYEIGLVSPTIKLQRIVLPNRSITQRFRGTKLTIYDVIQRFVSVYAPWATLSNALQIKTNNVICPEFQWTQPTLFEVLNDLLKVVNSVVTMPTYTQISLLDLFDRGDEVDVSKLNNMEVMQSIEEYASKLEIDAKNAVYPETNIQTYEWLMLKTTQGELMTVNNAELILAKPIYTIDRVEVLFYDNEKLTTDITDYVVEKTVYNSYRASNTLNVIHDKDYKRNALWYEEGKNIIGGFGYNEDGILGINTRPAINNILTDKLGLSDIALNSSQIFKYGFKVWYTSTEDVKFRVNEDKKNNAVMINNQESSHVDLRALARSNQDTVERIGKPIATIYARDYTPNIGDTMDDYVVTSVTERVYADGTEMTAELTENYVMENMFTAIKNRKRYQQYEAKNEAFLSEHLTEYNIRVTEESGFSYSDFERFMVQVAKKDYRIRAVVANVLYDTENVREFILNHSSHWLGTNAVRLNIKMDDNYSAGLRLEKETVFLIANRYSVQTTPYVDANGEFEAIELLLYKAFSNPNFAIDDDIWNDEAYDRARQLPLISDGLSLGSSDIVFDTNPLWRYKDNREITSETLQFYFIPDDNIFIGDLFYRHNPLTYMGDVDIDLYVWYSTTELYEDGDQLAKGTLWQLVTRVNNAFRASVSLETWNALGAISWCVADEDGNIYVAMNGDGRYIYIKSDYTPETSDFTVSGINISGIISAEYTMGDHYEVDDIDIIGYIDYAYEKGNDAYLEDIEVTGYISAGYSGGDHVTLTGINISGVISSEYESGYDPVVLDINIGGTISAETSGIAPDSYTVSGINVGGIISVSVTGIAPDNYEVDDISISGVMSAELSYEAPPIIMWVSGGTTPSGGTTCSVSGDLGNVRCDTTYVCAWVIQDSYFATANESTSPTCTIGGERTHCLRQGPTTWLCFIQEGQSQLAYVNCETCEEVEQ